MKSKLLLSALVGVFSFTAATIAQASPDAGAVECWVSKDGKDTKKMVKSDADCKKEGGHTTNEHKDHKEVEKKQS